MKLVRFIPPRCRCRSSTEGGSSLSPWNFKSHHRGSSPPSWIASWEVARGSFDECFIVDLPTMQGAFSPSSWKSKDHCRGSSLLLDASTGMGYVVSRSLTKLGVER
ncbi:hypothetical protein Dimus_018626 [Dionaea muscipula]